MMKTFHLILSLSLAFISLPTITSSTLAATIKGFGTVDGKVFSYSINKDKINDPEAHTFSITIGSMIDTSTTLEFIQIDSNTWSLKSFVAKNLPSNANLFGSSARSFNFDFTNSGNTPNGLDHNSDNISSTNPFAVGISVFDPINSTPELGKANVTRVRYEKTNEFNLTMGLLAFGGAGLLSSRKRIK